MVGRRQEDRAYKRPNIPDTGTIIQMILHALGLTGLFYFLWTTYRRKSMNNRFRLSISALARFLGLILPVAGFAQVTTSSIRATVVGPDASPLEGVDVTIVDTRTGATQSSQSNSPSEPAI